MPKSDSSPKTKYFLQTENFNLTSRKKICDKLFEIEVLKVPIFEIGKFSQTMSGRRNFANNFTWICFKKFNYEISYYFLGNEHS